MSEEYSGQIKVQSIIIRDETGKELIDLAKVNVSGVNGVGTIEIQESIAETSVRGVLTASSTRGEFEALKLMGNETIEFVMSTPATESQEEYSISTTKFKIYDFDESSDFSDTSLNPEGVASRIITLKFTSMQEADILSTKTPFPRGFVGKIALTESVQAPSEESLQSLLDDEEEPDPDPPAPIKGLINEISNLYFSDENFEIEKTDNSVVLSPKKFTLPNKKIVKNMNLMQLINYCTNYAWKKSDESGQEGSEEPPSDSSSEYGWSNYFFWQDLEKWNFKSATLLAQEGRSKGIKTFTFTDDMLSEGRLMKMDPISDFSINKAFSDGLLYSYYDRVEPNFENRYARFLDDSDKYTESRYDFNYGSDYQPIIGNAKFLPSEMFDENDGSSKPLSEWILSKANDENSKKDNLFGYYKDRQYNNKNELYRLVGRGLDKDTKLNEAGDLPGDNNPELADYYLYQDGMFQEMFDCVDIMGNFNGSSGESYTDVGVLNTIHKIKGDTFLAKNNYKRVMAYKEQWNVYRYSVCCEETIGDGENEIFAIIKDHKKIADNIYRYAWAEVSIIPKAELGFLVGMGFTHPGDPEGGTPGPSGDSELYNLGIFDEVDPSGDGGDTYGINSASLFDPDKKIMWLPHVQDFEVSYGGLEDSPGTTSRIGYFSGTILFLPIEGVCGDLYDGVTGSESWDNIKHLFKGASAEGLTLTFHNSHYSPFLVVEKPNSIRGSLENFSGAYNLNEIMNRNLLEGNSYPAVPFTGDTSGGVPAPMSTVFYQRSTIDGGDLGGSIYEEQDYTQPAFNSEHLVGPGINANDQVTEYPDSFDMMPVGGYKPLSGDLETVGCQAIPYGHVVRMSSVSYEDAMQVGIEPRNFPQEVSDKRLFYFSLANAHDGNCDGSCDL